MVAVIVPFLLIGPFSVVGAKGPRAVITDQPHEYLQDLEMPPFEVTSQDGERVTESVFDGRYTVMDFVFTNCTLACPTMFGNLIPLHNEMAGTEVRFLSISVDPVNDTPETLAAHAEKLSLDTRRWTLCASDAGTIDALNAALKFTVYEDPSTLLELDGGGTMRNIVHTSKVLLVGPDREILGLYSGLEPESIADLGRDLRAVLRQAK